PPLPLALLIRPHLVPRSLDQPRRLQLLEQRVQHARGEADLALRPGAQFLGDGVPVPRRLGQKRQHHQFHVVPLSASPEHSRLLDPAPSLYAAPTTLLPIYRNEIYPSTTIYPRAARYRACLTCDGAPRGIVFTSMT